MSDQPSPAEVITALRAEREDSALRTRLEIQRWFAVLQVLIPAAMLSAKAGNVTMRDAMNKVYPLLPK